MSLKSVKILGVNVTINTKEEILEYVRKYLNEKEKGKRKKEKGRIKPLIIVTPNPEQIVRAQKDRRFAQILNHADVALPDGVGISLAAKFLNVKCQMSNVKWKWQRIPGVDFLEDLVVMAAKEGIRIGLIGGRGGVAVKALECLQRRYPGLVGWAEEPEEIKIKNQKSKIKNTDKKLKRSIQQFNNIATEQFGKDVTEQYFHEVAERILSTGTRFVFVGLGAPKQEMFMESIKRQASSVKRQARVKKNLSHDPLTRDTPLILMSVGGAFDILSGKIVRAPYIVRSIGLEWLWRLSREPWRWRRQLALLKFTRMAIREKLASKG